MSATAAALRQLAHALLEAGEPAMVVQVVASQGSAPRDAGTRMLVTPQRTHGTIGGGHLEWQAISLARHAMAETPGQHIGSWAQRFPLGPALGQCCGGVVTLHFAPLQAHTLAQWPLPTPSLHIELHGAGHVGQAIVRLLTDLECSVRWIDERCHEQGASPLPGTPDADQLAALPPHIQWLPTDDAAAEVPHAPAQACHLVLTHRHDLDLRIIDAVLRRGDARLAGLIGSDSKRASFQHRLAARGLSPEQIGHMVCPIGLPGLAGKAPAVIAIATVAQVLMLDQAPLPPSP